jgi:hypothetical protein
MKLAEKILNFFEKEYKGIEYDIVKDSNSFHAEIEREEVEGTKSKSATTTDKRAKEYIDQVI